MQAFLAIGASAGADAHLRRIRTLLEAYGWSCRVDTGRIAILTLGALGVSAAPGGEGWILGDVYSRSTGAAWASEPDRQRGEGAVTVAERLCARAFGGYVVIFPPEGPWRIGLFRDPSGAVDAHLWEEGPLVFAASTLARTEVAALAPRARAVSSRLSDMLADPAEAFGESLLDHVTAVTPGVLSRLTSGGPVTHVVWTPARIAAASAGDSSPARDAGYARDLVTLVDRCVDAYASGAGRCLVEVSGGVDSSIVATSMARRNVSAVAAWPTYVSEEPGADERPYAGAVARRLGVALTEMRKHPVTLDAAFLKNLSPGARPGLNAGDPDYDASLGALALETGADAVITGQGGDTVFWTHRSPLVAGPIVTRLGVRACLDPQVQAIALWTRRSVWAVYASNRDAARGRPGGAKGAPLLPAHPDLRRTGAASAQHPWLRDLEAVEPAKRLQITELAHCQRLHGESPRSAHLRQLHPLLAQPVVELSLRAPALSLVRGGRDRAMARRAFAARLPSEVLTRRGKGDLTAYYARTLARSIDVVRPYLLEGELARRGLLDRPALEVMLSVERLIQDAPTPDLMDLLAIESWVQRWATRPGA